MDGWLRIGTKLDNSKFETQVMALENQIEELEDKAQPLKESMEEYRATIQTIAEEIKKVNEEHLTTEQIMERINGLANEGFDYTGDFEKLRETMSDEEAYLKIIEFIQQGLTEELKEQQNAYKKINNQIDINKTKLESLKQSHISFGKEGTKAFKSMTKSAKTLLLGLIGIRSAYSILSKISHAALENNENLGKQIESVWTGLGALLEPVIKVIVELFKKAATAVLYFVGLLTHQNLIEKANAAILKNREKALKKQTKATNELNKANQKFTASFDELNMVQEQTSKSQNTIEPLDNSLLFNVKDLSESTRKFLEDLNEKLRPVMVIIGDIIKWAKDHPNLIITILGGAALLSLLSKIMGVSGVSGLLGINSLLLSIAAIGVISIIINVKKMGEDIEKYKNLKDELSSKQKDQTAQTLKEQEAERKRIATYKKDSKEVAKLTKKLNEQIDAEEGFRRNVQETMHNMTKREIAIAKQTGEWDLYNEMIVESVKREEQYIETSQELYRQGKLNEEQIYEHNVRITRFNESLRGTSEFANRTRAAFSELSGGTEELWKIGDRTKAKMQELGFEITKVKGAGEDLEDEIKQVSKALNDLPSDVNTEIKLIKTKETINDATDVMAKISNITGKPQNIKITSTTNVVQSAVNTLSKTLNDMTKKNYKLKVSLMALSQATEIGEIIALGFTKPTKGMATGGIHIVNNPGRGVMSGNVRYAEAGAEGILPLTDASAMERLGQEIGKNIVLNATLINKINGRTLSKEVQQILAESGFYANV